VNSPEREQSAEEEFNRLAEAVKLEILVGSSSCNTLRGSRAICRLVEVTI
jgi:hypothetical protein